MEVSTLLLLAAVLLLIGGLILLTHVGRAYTPTEGPRHDQHRATKRRGDRTMTDVVAGTAQERVIRWMEEGQAVLDSVRGMLHERTQLKMVAEVTQKEGERLRQEGDQLRAEVSRLTAETERLRTERADTAQWFTALMKEAASRLRIEPPPA